MATTTRGPHVTVRDLGRDAPLRLGPQGVYRSAWNVRTEGERSSIPVR